MRFTATLEWAALALLVFQLPLLQFYSTGLEGSRNALFTVLGLVGAGLCAAAIAKGWNGDARRTGPDFAVLSGVAAFLLLCVAALQLDASWLALVGATLTAALLFFAARTKNRAVETVTLGFGLAAILILAYAPLGSWIAATSASLGGLPVTPDGLPTSLDALKQLLLPAALVGGSLWLVRRQLRGRLMLTMTALAGTVAFIAFHIFYRHGFAALASADGIASGYAQRAVWGATLTGVAWGLHRFVGTTALGRRATLALAATALAYLTVYSLGLHNPLWAEQAVGSLPLVNWLLLTAIVLFVALWLVERSAAAERPDRAAASRRASEIGRMSLVTYFAVAMLTQAFRGSVLAAGQLDDAENIARSILAILLATGFLLWGIRTRQRDWRIASLILMLIAVGKVFLFDASGLTGLIRIASFMALGFSLIGIGWLYSRQLRRETT